jgi:hypothetical protein
MWTTNIDSFSLSEKEENIHVYIILYEILMGEMCHIWTTQYVGHWYTFCGHWFLMYYYKICLGKKPRDTTLTKSRLLILRQIYNSGSPKYEDQLITKLQSLVLQHTMKVNAVHICFGINGTRRNKWCLELKIAHKNNKISQKCHWFSWVYRLTSL